MTGILRTHTLISFIVSLQAFAFALFSVCLSCIVADHLHCIHFRFPAFLELIKHHLHFIFLAFVVVVSAFMGSISLHLSCICYQKQTFMFALHFSLAYMFTLKPCYSLSLPSIYCMTQLFEFWQKVESDSNDILMTAILNIMYTEPHCHHIVVDPKQTLASMESLDVTLISLDLQSEF